MEKQGFEVKVSIKDLFRILINRLWLIALAAIIVGGSYYAYSSYTYKPMYKSVSRIYILRQNEKNDESASSYAQNLNAALTIVNDCKQIIKSETTMKQVIASTGINDSPSALMSAITLSSTSESRIVQIIAKASTPEKAKLLADSVATNGLIRLEEVVGYKQASIMEEGNLPGSPTNTVFSSKVFIFAGIAGAIVYLFFVLMFLSNDRIREPEEINDYLGLSVLGMIPNEEEISSKKKRNGYDYYAKHKSHQSEASQNSVNNSSSKEERG